MIDSESAALAWVLSLSDCDAMAERRLKSLVELLQEESRNQNLVSANSLASVWRRHIADSAQLLSHVPRETTPWLDLGSGAGFPGIVVAILAPRSTVVLVESRARRVVWLNHLVRVLDLANVQVVGEALERVPSFAAGAISARAFAPLERLLLLAGRFSTPATQWLLPKGQSAAKELVSLRGWNHMFHVEQSMTDDQSGIIVGRLLGSKASTA